MDFTFSYRTGESKVLHGLITIEADDLVQFVRDTVMATAQQTEGNLDMKELEKAFRTALPSAEVHLRLEYVV